MASELGARAIFRRRIGWAAFAVLFFILYSFVALRAPSGMFNSPDEMSNHYFATVVAKHGAPRAADPFWEITGGEVYPRAVTVVEGYHVPASFHGLPVLYGWIARVAGQWTIVFLTPLLAVLALVAWRRTIAEVFGGRAGTISVFLLAITPAWWYFSNRALYHNILFTSLLIFAVYFFIIQPIRGWMERNKKTTTYNLIPTNYDHIISGLMIGLAIWVRTSEILWVGLATLALLIVFRKTVQHWQVVDFLIAVGLALLPILIFNQLLYDHPLASGYNLQSEETSAVYTNTQSIIQPTTTYYLPSNERAQSGVHSQIVERGREATSGAKLLPTTYLFPFGFHPRTALIHWNRYFVMLPAWMTLATLLGFICLVYRWWKRRTRRNEIVLGALFLGVTGWLALVYGSWVIHDNPDPTAITIGISYSRYWLPLFVLGSGVAGVGLARLAERLEKSTRWGLAALLYALFMILSFSAVFLTPGDGLRDVVNTLSGYALVKEDVLRRTEPGAVIVADRGDKLFFPDRHVITPLRQESTYAALQALQENHTPLYYYGITLTLEDLRYHNEEKLPPYGLRIFPSITYGDHTLYHFVSVTESP